MNLSITPLVPLILLDNKIYFALGSENDIYYLHISDSDYDQETNEFTMIYGDQPEMVVTYRVCQFCHAVAPLFDRVQIAELLLNIARPIEVLMI